MASVFLDGDRNVEHMSTAKFVEVHVGDVVRLRKPHPCGGTDWTVVRLGADIGLHCVRCQHRIMLARSVFERRRLVYPWSP